MIKDIIKNKGDEISVLDSNDKLEYLIDLAKDCESLEDKYKIDKNSPITRDDIDYDLINNLI